MQDSNDSLDDMLRRAGGRKAPPKTEPTPEPAEESEELTLKQMDGHYASMRPANKNLTRMHVITRNGDVETFQYHYLDVKSTFKGGEFELTFTGTKHWKLTVKGRGPKFWIIYDLCTLHRWPYLREATGSMPGAIADGETVLTEIKISDVTPRELDE